MQRYRCRILIVDDYKPFREGLRMLLASQDDVEVVGEAADGQEAVDVVRRCQPDVILMDLNMPRMSGIAAATHIQNSLKDAIIIGLCVMQDTYLTDAFMRAGASAVVAKDRLTDLEFAIHQACKGKAGQRVD